MIYKPRRFGPAFERAIERGEREKKLILIICLLLIVDVFLGFGLARSRHELREIGALRAAGSDANR